MYWRDYKAICLSLVFFLVLMFLSISVSWYIFSREIIYSQQIRDVLDNINTLLARA